MAAWWLTGIVVLVLGLAVAWLSLAGSPLRHAATHFDLVLEPTSPLPDVALSPAGDELVFVSTEHHAVLTRGAPEEIEVLVRRVGVGGGAQ